MAYEIDKKQVRVAGITLFFIAVAVVLYFGFKQGGWFRSGTTSGPQEGSDCMTKDTPPKAGTIQGGVCVAKRPLGPPNPHDFVPST